MQIEALTRTDQIRPGDTLLISDGKTITPATALRVKVSEYDGTEVIFDEKRNKFFNVGMYLEGTSWAKDVRVVKLSPRLDLDGKKIIERDCCCTFPRTPHRATCAKYRGKFKPANA